MLGFIYILLFYFFMTGVLLYPPIQIIQVLNNHKTHLLDKEIFAILRDFNPK